ncbi:hypothetical protein BDZ97DRAFT_1822112 [Flammula alnicola]|nr:hypothetical protein BDZ97DRAFT_1822112 [Flammula alnicola]
MIIKPPLPDDPTPADAPPSYDTLGANSSTQNYRSEKSPVVDQPAGPSRLSPHSPLLSPPPLPLKSPSLSSSSSSGPSPTNNKGKGRAGNWFTFTASPQERTMREVRTTVLGLVRDLIQEHISNSPAAAGILQSCADACASHSISFSSLLQEKSIENHTPLYWAIVKRLPDEHMNALISYASPLTKETITELRLACLATSDQALFQRLRLSPEFAPVSGPTKWGAFAANFVIPHFHKRMVVTKEIALEFIARSRMWRLAFFIAPEPRTHGVDPPTGSWCISLSLVETSPPTFVNSRLLISEAKSPQTPTSPVPPEPPSPPRKGIFRLPPNISNIPRERYPRKICPFDQADVERPIAGSEEWQPGKNIVIALEDSLSGANLQYGYVVFSSMLVALFRCSLSMCLCVRF